MCRIYGAVRFQIRGGARPALVTEADVRAVTEIVSALSAPPREGRELGAAGGPLLVGAVAAAITLGWGLLALALLLGGMPAPLAMPVADRAALLGVSAQVQHLDVRAHGFLLDVAKTPGVPASGVQVFIFSWMVPHADVIRSARLVIVGRCVPLSPAGTWRLSGGSPTPGTVGPIMRAHVHRRDML